LKSSGAVTDANRTQAGHDLAMSSEAVGRIVLELEPGEPIRGRLLDGRGGGQAFRGWLELTAALDRAREPGLQPTNTPVRVAPEDPAA
jgi:hypothetical protein